ncbi:hypothetical protein B0T17DRAFT_632599 [Bombardia bombarda]|uniref:Uncharacterized protein n=1 Tax=Bombardia bombarda TaxID=252184 RepID=A0AA39X7H2_9PEZI|nr:hypothetical protein B0T17DRAFT_632599 [Bombardia bombarda]
MASQDTPKDHILAVGDYLYRNNIQKLVEMNPHANEEPLTDYEGVIQIWTFLGTILSDARTISDRPSSPLSSPPQPSPTPKKTVQFVDLGSDTPTRQSGNSANHRHGGRADLDQVGEPYMFPIEYRPLGPKYPSGCIHLPLPPQEQSFSLLGWFGIVPSLQKMLRKQVWVGPWDSPILTGKASDYDGLYCVVDLVYKLYQLEKKCMGVSYELKRLNTALSEFGTAIDDVAETTTTTATSSDDRVDMPEFLATRYNENRDKAAFSLEKINSASERISTMLVWIQDTVTIILSDNTTWALSQVEDGRLLLDGPGHAIHPGRLEAVLVAINLCCQWHADFVAAVTQDLERLGEMELDSAEPGVLGAIVGRGPVYFAQRDDLKRRELASNCMLYRYEACSEALSSLRAFRRKMSWEESDAGGDL